MIPVVVIIRVLGNFGYYLFPVEVWCAHRKKLGVWLCIENASARNVAEPSRAFRKCVFSKPLPGVKESAFKASGSFRQELQELNLLKAKKNRTFRVLKQ